MSRRLKTKKNNHTQHKLESCQILAILRNQTTTWMLYKDALLDNQCLRYSLGIHKKLRNCTYKISNYFFYKNYLYIETRQNIFKQHYCRRHKVSCFPFSYKYHEMSKFTYIFGNDYFVTVICSIQQNINIYSPKTVRGLRVRVGAPSVDNIILLF